MLSLLFTALAFGFACGAVPFGYFVGRLRGIDIRQAGSGNIGFTNVARVLGWPYAAPVLVLDFAKGLLPTAFVAALTSNYLVPPGDVLLLPRLFGSGLILLRVTAGLGAIVGHMFTPVLRFRGGKGVATTAGVIVALSPLAFAVCLLAFVLVLLTSRYLSLASMTAAILLPVSTAVILPRQWLVFVFTALIALLVLLRHSANIRRLRHGQEPHFRLKPRTPPAGSDK